MEVLGLNNAKTPPINQVVATACISCVTEDSGRAQIIDNFKSPAPNLRILKIYNDR